MISRFGLCWRDAQISEQLNEEELQLVKPALMWHERQIAEKMSKCLQASKHAVGLSEVVKAEFHYAIQLVSWLASWSDNIASWIA